MNEGFDILNDWANWTPEVSEALVRLAVAAGLLVEQRERADAGLVPPHKQLADAWEELRDSVWSLGDAIGKA